MLAEKKIYGLILLTLSFIACRQVNQISGTDDRVESLLQKMTLEEKVGQMTNIGLMAVCKGDFWERGDTIEIDTAKLKKMLLEHHIGSIQNMGKYPPSKEEWRRLIEAIQEVAMNESRLGIPVLYGIDGTHGANYTAGSVLFPHQIGIAATWDPSFAEEMARITAYEIRASGISWNYSPVLDVSKEPLWGRIYETFGEDTYMNQVMGEAMTKGAQGDELSSPYSTAVCLKHFAGYGMPYNGKDRSAVFLPERIVRQNILPPFESAINNGALTVMLSSGSLNGMPSHCDHHLITNILKGEFEFDGFTISDWADVDKLIEVHQVAKDEKEAIKKAVLAGLDMSMDPYDESFAINLKELVEDGEVPMSRIDDAVRRILNVKYKLGLFETAIHDASLYQEFGSEAFSKQSYQTALESLTLLKNDDQILPLDLNKKVLVTGVAANSLNYLNGGWSRTWSGQETEYNDEEKFTILEALQNALGNQNVSYVQGTDYTENIDTKEAVRIARNVDYIIACLGEIPATEKPSDTDDLTMPQVQLDLVKELAKTGKPVILVLVEGRPRIISEIEPISNAILMAYLPGQEGGKAIADILLGKANPSGKLPYTYPRFTGTIIPYDHLKSEAIDKTFGEEGFDPLYEFGYGLSYTEFEYSDLKLSSDEIEGNESLEIDISIKNTGDRNGKEVVQLYISDVVASLSPPVKQLKRFQKIELAPGETKTVTFNISRDDLTFVDNHNNWIVEAGEFKLQIGDLEKVFYLKN